MNRRDFMKGVGLSAVALTSAHCGLGADEEAMAPWLGPGPDVTDPLERVLCWARLAPNPHNTQAWRIQRRGDLDFSLYVDRERTLPHTDPPYRQVHIGQGTFLELASLAALDLGYRPYVELFPQGAYGQDELEDLPVARVRLTEDASVRTDELFAQVRRRTSNKRRYLPGAPARDHLAKLGGDEFPNVLPLQTTVDPELVATLRGIAKDAFVQETRKAPTQQETVDWFRFSRREVEEKRDGFSVVNSAADPVSAFVFEQFLAKRDGAEDPHGEFANQGIDTTTTQLDSAGAFGWIVTQGNSRRDQVNAGRAYLRVNLRATQHGLAMHPMSQALQEYAEVQPMLRDIRAALGVAPGQTLQMFFRLGVADPAPHTARRRLDDFWRDAG